MAESIYEVVPNIGYLLSCPITSETADDLMLMHDTRARMVVTNRHDVFVTMIVFHKSVTFIFDRHDYGFNKLINYVDEKMEKDGYTKVTTIPTEPKTYQILTKKGEGFDLDLIQVRLKSHPDEV